ncbi:hypothetical protein, partial [Rhizobium fabae]|uniref:hypothetical protein n=1 Tax=Rhizobium fabae TaxID=573179 RepID=UPI001AEDEF84
AGYSREEPGAGNPPARICEGEAEWHSYSTTILHAVVASHFIVASSSRRRPGAVRGFAVGYPLALPGISPTRVEIGKRLDHPSPLPTYPC